MNHEVLGEPHQISFIDSIKQSQKLGFPVNWKVVSEKKIFYDLQTINVQNIQFQTIQTIMKTD